MSNRYRPAEIELRHYRRWADSGYFAPSGEGEAYSIVIPPPNVTGTLHMGHAFQVTIMDALTRYHRMRGRNTLWQPGADHAGIATQMVVERQLQAEGTTRQALGREAFEQRVWAWKARSGNTINTQLERLAASVDWSRDCFTMDPALSRAVIEVFVRLYDEGIIYRGTRLTNWDPKLHTALSDLEVLSSEERGKLWRFRYPIEGAEGVLVVATTRPETMLGDTAVAVHPEDDRYRHFVGKTVRLPLAERSIPVIADSYVDPEFGTGCVKITPAHDFNDYEIGLRHDLPMINIFDRDAALNSNVPERYRNLDRFEARERVVEDLDAVGLLDGVSEHAAMIPRGDRSGVIVEPLLTDQWYVRAEPLARPAIEAVEQGRVRFVPENWSKIYFEWMRNIHDWCISRQLWWGHRIPAWYDGAGRIYVARTEAEARRKHALGDDVALRQDEDVLDTWFSSALWPFSTMGWPDPTKELATFYPTTVLVTGFDIIFFWVARMIMMGLRFIGDVPFRHVYIHPLVRDQEGQKMSKSKGNILDPIDLVDGVDLTTLLEKRTSGMMQPHLKSRVERITREEFPDGIRAYGTDALRYTFASLATMGQDVRFDLGRIEGYHRFCNKLWNAAAYVFNQLPEPSAGDHRATVADRWILSRLNRTVEEVHRAYASYRLDLMAQVLYDFTWHEFCDWYVELTKPILTGDDANPAEQRAARATLAEVLGGLCKLLHPLIPFITEELWLQLCARTGIESDTVMLERMPEADSFAADAGAEAEMTWIQGFIVGVRQIRGEMNISRVLTLPVRLAGAAASDRQRLVEHESYLQRLAGIGTIESVDSDEDAPGSATALLGEMRILVPLAGLIDVEAERKRLSKQLDRVRSDVDKARRKLANPNFVDKAPPDIVARERARVDEFGLQADQLERQLQRLKDLA
ncbi:valine--tRNA ligase [Candidatus Rariloculus sp.]|uniref:valine--tRNA ligase n=1 Tax=Candidatus Rariloculus sp. TaxID=3101265 RepID=UPI003D106E27